MSANVMIWTDSLNRSFNARLTIADAERLKHSGVDIFADGYIETLFGDPLKLIEVIAEAWRPQWEKLGIQYADFADLLMANHESFPAARKAFEAGVVGFFRRLGREALARYVEKASETAERTYQALARKVDSDKTTELFAAAVAKCEREFDARLEAQHEMLTNGS